MTMDEVQLNALVNASGVTKSESYTNGFKKLAEAIKKHPELCLAGYPEIVRDASKTVEEMKTLYGNLNLARISDRQTIDSVLAYKNILQATKDVFGEENLTENVMVAAIQAASYTAYRNIMGPAATQTNVRR